MKAILLVLFVGVLSCSAGLLKLRSHQYQPIANLNDADNAALTWGWGEVIKKGQASGKIGQGTVTITNVNSAEKAIGAGTGYNFDVDGDDGRGTAVNAKFSVYVNSKGQNNLNSWNYKTSSAPTAWTDVSKSDADAQAALNYGIKQLVDVGSKIPKSNYNVEKLNSVQTRYNFGAQEYQFDVVLFNGFDARVTATFTVSVDAKGKYSFGAYNYKVKTGKL